MWIINTYKKYKSPKGHIILYNFNFRLFFCKRIVQHFSYQLQTFNQCLLDIMHTSTLAENDHV